VQGVTRENGKAISSLFKGGTVFSKWRPMGPPAGGGRGDASWNSSITWRKKNGSSGGEASAYSGDTRRFLYIRWRGGRGGGNLTAIETLVLPYPEREGQQVVLTPHVRREKARRWAEKGKPTTSLRGNPCSSHCIEGGVNLIHF